MASGTLLICYSSAQRTSNLPVRARLLTMAFRTVAIFFALALICASVSPADSFELPQGIRARKWQVRALKQARKRLRDLIELLKNFETSSKCLADKRARRADILERLRVARSCRYRGSLSEYKRLRELCRSRSEIQNMLQKANKRCSKFRFKQKNMCIAKKVVPLRQKRTAAYAACRTIGWTGPGSRPCENIMKLKEDLEEVGAIRCGTKDSREEILADIAKTKERIRYLLTLIRPQPSNDPATA